MELKAGPALQQLVAKALAAELIPFEASAKSTYITLSGEATKVSEQGSTVQVLVEISKDRPVCYHLAAGWQETVIQQLQGLLGGGLSITELGDLYCYRRP